ncbi:cupin domain-containing protein [Kibdelosporangium persicum]|uniref:Cupin domain n=1 Tax=Kibdelosporangium persicum TaxID=2698649 RepID=A0ABX2FDX0_9PSEU|nr:cupin domain-containing protein [Kibdelosporangium persicum]NRN68955.1 Cupin domain [Kibdelosporangium persicum]
MRTTAFAGVVLSTLALAATAAEATPSSGVTGTIISKTTFGGKDYILREITLQAGGTTGWHFHQGTLYAYVRNGTLTHNESDCSIDGIYQKGAAFTEPPNQVHVGRNLGTTPVVLEVLYVLPKDAPLSDDAPNPGCDFQ